MIQAVTPLRGRFMPTVYSVGAAGKRAVPVRPLVSVYARFKHVMGVPSADGQISLGKLRILDNLIDRLIQYRGGGGGPVKVSSENVDRLIRQYEGQLSTAMRASKPPFGGMYSGRGIVLDTVA